MLGVPLNQDKESYYAKVQSSAAQDIANIINRYSLQGKLVLSIGSGYGAEEDLFAENGCIVHCIEPDKGSADFHRTKAHPNVFISEDPISLFEPQTHYSLIYTSSPSDWMYGYMPMPLPYLRTLKHTDLFIARLYGGNFRTRVLKNPALIWILKKLTAFYGLPLSEYWLTQDVKDKNTATLVCGGTPDDRFPITTERFGKPSFRLI